jgi:hypothetical protein
MIYDHLGGLNVHGVLMKPLVEIPIRLAAALKQEILNVVQLVIVARLIVDVVA